MNVTKTDITIPISGDVALGGWLFVPENQSGPLPAITMSHGFAAVKEHELEPLARTFAHAGFVVLVHDHRGFGSSTGWPRHDINPWVQIEDWRRALTYLEALEVVDADRIGIWGTSYSGGHVLVLGAVDRRIKCVVSQVPTVSGYLQGLRRVAPHAMPALLDAFNKDERSQLGGEAPTVWKVVARDDATPAMYRDPEAIAFYERLARTKYWENQVTLRSAFAARMYEPGLWAARVSPTPLLMIVATQDRVTLTDLELHAYEQALEPKQLELIHGGHFAPYLDAFDKASGAALSWFSRHLM